ncbi:MAG: hypothetical protein M0R06_02185 [Sphaerochaeta sp.]|nr:hypothetical protein [Sphaerochaeta sp.]
MIWHKADAAFYFNDGTGWEPIADLTSVTAVRALYTYRPADAAALAALTGMRAGDGAIQVDTGVEYRYSGTAWKRIPGDVVASGTFTTAATVTIDGLTGFDEYEIVFDIPTVSTANAVTGNLRAAGVTLSANYDAQSLTGAATAVAAAEVYGQTSWAFSNGNRTDKHITIRLSRLNEAVRTAGSMTALEKNAGSAAVNINRSIWHTAATACDGIIITASTGTITGTYIVRGLA